jgi:protein phosphatase
MQSTLSAIALLNDQAVIGHVGDSRIYQVRDREIQQLTHDHSEVAELVRMQIITQEEARHHPRRNVITRTVGSEPFLQAEFRNIEVELGDTFVLCTDGLWEPVEDPEIASAVVKHTAAEACRVLIDLAVTRGTTDNLSIQVAKVVEWERHGGAAPARKQSLIHRTLQLFGMNRKGA